MNVTIALLEDDALVRVAVATFFRTQGIEVVAGSSGSAVAGLIAMERLQPALIIADFRLGLKTAADEVPDVLAVLPKVVPVVVTTGDTSPETRTLIEGCGWDLLIKPYKPQDLLSIITEPHKAANQTI